MVDILISETRTTEVDGIHITRFWKGKNILGGDDYYQTFTIESLPPPPLDKYKKVVLPLTTARTDVLFAVDATYFTFISTDGTFSIRFGENTNDVLTPTDLQALTGTLVPIIQKKIYLTNSAQAGKSIQLLLWG
jgi:hypothetical protein